MLALGTLQEQVSVMVGYRIPVLLSRYAVHLLGSDWSFDQSRIERELGFSPSMSYESGLAATERWYRESRQVSA
jgi:nucleoside-diphosphate-sugar epimerase